MVDLTTDYWRFVSCKAQYSGAASYFEINSNWRDRLEHSAGPSGELLRRSLAGAGSILDVGAGNRSYEQVFARLGLGATYASADLDKSYQHEYTDFLQVEDRFDAITMFELIEHMDANSGVAFLEHAYSILPSGGVLVLSTPNPHHPNHVWRVEVTHVRPWPQADLYGALRLVGFSNVEIHRQFVRPTTSMRWLLPIHKALYRLMGLDHAHTLLAVARKA